MTGQQILGKAVQKLMYRHDLKGWCQRYTDQALTDVAPQRSLPNAATALRSLHLMKQDPAHYGYVPVHDINGQPYCLVYFDRCGGNPQHLADARLGEVCGHVGIYSRDTHIIYSSKDYGMTPYFMARVAGAYVPMDA